MAKTHWMTPDNAHGCQHSECRNKADFQWQRAATEEEIAADRATVGQYGAAIRNLDGPHTTAVFGCADHIPTRPADGLSGEPDVTDLEWLAKRHISDCPAPNDGCICD